MIATYLEEIILALIENPNIESFNVIKKKIAGTDGYIRIKANLTSDDLLEISLYCQKREESIEIVDYRYHWQDKNGVLKKRWDSCPHHREIETYPFHVHLDKQTIRPSGKMDIYKVLELIEKDIKDQS